VIFFLFKIHFCPTVPSHPHPIASHFNQPHPPADMMRMQIAGHINHCQLVAPELSFILFPLFPSARKFRRQEMNSTTAAVCNVSWQTDTDRGPRTADNGQRTTDWGPRTADYGLRIRTTPTIGFCGTANALFRFGSGKCVCFSLKKNRTQGLWPSFCPFLF